jgi:predicted ester cyclase
MAKLAGDFRRAFPDVRWRVDIVLGEGDLVAARWTATGTHTGAWGAVEPTGNAASFSGVNMTGGGRWASVSDPTNTYVEWDGLVTQ